MNALKILLLAFMLIPLLARTASAATLTVIMVGTGGGDVEGGEIFCGPFCSAIYKEKTVIHLKTIPDDDSRFVGWMVDGKLSGGVIAIDQEDVIVTAKFELRSWTPDELRPWWYNGNVKEQATMVLDEIAVFFEGQVMSKNNEYKMAVQEILPRFHPLATITDQHEGGAILYLKSPEAVTKDQLLNILSSVKAHKHIQQASPILYSTPGDSLSREVPTGQIFVVFPEEYTEDRILAIEREYGLSRVEVIEYTPNTFMYAVDNPLESIDLARRLYESGQVVHSSPELVREVELYNAIPKDKEDKVMWTTNTGHRRRRNVCSHVRAARSGNIYGSSVIFVEDTFQELQEWHVSKNDHD